jgi:protein TonB
MAVKEFTERQEERRPDALTEVREESAEPVVASEGVLTAAEPLDFVNASPKYPYIARKRGWEGTVEIEAVITPKGDAQVVRVYRSSGFAVLDEEALKTVRSWRFHSARRGPVAVQSTIIIPVHFQLTGDQNNDDSGF